MTSTNSDLLVPEMKEEVEDEWVPLEVPLDDDDSNIPHPKQDGQEAPRVATATVTTAVIPAPIRKTTSNIATIPSTRTNSDTPTPSTSTSSNDTIQTLQRRVEMRRHLQQRLVHHPLQLLWSHFLWHLAHEFWSLDLQIRIAFLFFFIGAVCKTFCIMTWYMWYPRTILFLCILLGSWIYLNPNDIPQRVQRWLEQIVNLPHRIPETLEYLDPQLARRLCVVLLFLPTILQLRTISFLATTNATGGGLMWNLTVTLMMTAVGAYYILLSPTTTATGAKKTAVRDVSQICLVVLYGSALWISLRQWNIMTMPSLAAPFFLSTGTLLLSYDDHDNMEWFSRLVRYSLRLTLRDVLATVGTSVQEDEMLQLAMLRWIVDYWSFTPPQPAQSTQQQQSQPSTTTGSTTNAQHVEPPDLQWDELLPMLNMATDQMTSEVHSLQQQTSETPSSSSTPAPAPPTPAPPSSSSGASSSGTNNAGDDSLRNLQTMLASMNVDDRAKPAVAAWKRTVETFPPSRQLAVAVSVIRRCPACLAFLWQVLVASMFQAFSTTFYVILLLVPLLALEVMRIQAWALACESLSRVLDDDDAVNNNSGEELSTADRNDRVTPALSTTASNTAESFSRIMSRVDPMIILLSGDEDTIVSTVQTDTTSDGVTSVTAQMTVPTLLIVWRNIQSSVGALEVSLTAARVAQTGVVAVEFAKNVMSLAQFGSEVARHGWMHGLTVIAKEVIFTHNGDVRSTPRGGAATFTQAAFSAVHNGQVVAHNLQVLATEDEKVGQIMGPIVGFMGLLGGLFRNDKKEEQDNTSDEGTESNTKSNDGASKEDANVGSKSAARGTADPVGTYDDSTESGIPETKEGPQDTNKPVDDDKGGVTEKKIEPVAAVSQSPDQSPLLATEEKEADAFVPLLETKEAALNVDSDKRKFSDSSLIINSASVMETIVAKPDNTDTAKSANSKSIESPLQESSKATKHIVDQSKSKEDGQDVDDLALVMELIADAFELHLIDENEKNQFCLKLSNGTHDKEIVSGMKTTLQGLILETSHDHDQDESLAGTDLAPADRSSKSTIEKGHANTETPSSGSPWSPIVESAGSEEAATIQPFDYSERLANAVKTRDELNMPLLAEEDNTTLVAIAEGEGDVDGIPTVASAPSRRDDDDNMWVKVGGGIAVLGAVVGGAFLAMHQDNPNNTNENRNQANASAVTIERLDNNDDEGRSDWEPTVGDGTTQAQ